MKIDNDKVLITTACELRRQAEERLSDKSAELQPTRSKESRRRLDHELEVHQIELGMQNVELRHSRDDVEILLDKYAVLYDFAPVGYLTLDVNGTIHATNLTSADILGVERVRLLGRRFGQFVTEENRLLFADFMGKVFASHGKESCEVMLTIEGKSALMLQIDAVAMNSGQECSVVAIDITERKRTEEALRFSEARYRALFLDNPTMICTLDTTWKILSANPFVASHLGYTIDELEGQSVLKLFHEDDRVSVVEQLQKCVQNPNQVFRWQFRKTRKDGEKLWVEEIAQAVHNLNGSLDVLVVCQDITERKQSEDRRERLLLKLEAVLESINEGVVISDLEGNLLTMNQEALDLHEVEQDTQVRWPLAKLQDRYELIDPSGRTVPFEQWPASRAIRGERFTDYEVRVRNKETGKLWLASYNGTPVRNKSGDNILAVITVRDISDRKFAEEEIKRLNVSLAARTIDLEYAIQELEAFNYTAAHDLRNPLNVISSYCQALKEMCGSKLDPQCQLYIQETYDGTLRMNQLIEALLNFSQMSHAKLNRKSVDLSKIARDVAEELKGTEATRRVTFLIEDGIVADGDANLLRVVLTNLLGNAWKYTGIRNEAIIEFGVMKIEGKQTCFVRDNGAGFDNASAKKIFAPFQRLSSSEAYRGFGIGLATVERIIRRHGGRVYAEGEPDKGTTIYFTLSATGGFT